MTTVELTSRVDADGVLNLSIPLGVADANREVRVIVEALERQPSVEEWTRLVRTSAGSIPDEMFDRH